MCRSQSANAGTFLTKPFVLVIMLLVRIAVGRAQNGQAVLAWHAEARKSSGARAPQIVWRRRVVPQAPHGGPVRTKNLVRMIS